MSRKVKFYSEQEVATMKLVIKNGEKLAVAAKRLSKDFKRTEGSIYVKLLSLSDRIGKKKTAKVVTQKSDKGVTLRNGFVFDFKPQRAEMFQDHVRIYF